MVKFFGSCVFSVFCLKKMFVVQNILVIFRTLRITYSMRVAFLKGKPTELEAANVLVIKVPFDQPLP